MDGLVSLTTAELAKDGQIFIGHKNRPLFSMRNSALGFVFSGAPPSPRVRFSATANGTEVELALIDEVLSGFGLAIWIDVRLLCGRKQ
jgi:hypothetical protein